MKNCERCGELFDESELSDTTGCLACDPCNEQIALIEEKEEELEDAKKALEEATEQVMYCQSVISKLQKELDEISD